MSTIIKKPVQPNAPSTPANLPADEPPSAVKGETILSHLVTALIYTVVSVVILGVIYPLVITAIGALLFPHQAGGSMIVQNGRPVGSAIIGQLFTKPQYFQGRPSAAGKNGYDPTSTGGTNLAPTSKKLIDATKATIAALEKANPDAGGPPPMDLVTSSGSGIDPDISPEGAAYQAPRVAKARGMSLDAVRALIAAHVVGRTFGILGEPRVNVLALNLALDAKGKP
jgi:K+-transporting ATPase ATPase C chain